jgi:ABC-2 type transport system permease protein
MFALSLTLGFLVQFGIEMLLGLAALWLVEVRGLHGLVVWGISGVCSGYFLPLELYPDWLAAISRALPFQSFIYTPAAIWVGRLAGGDAAQAIAVQVVWVVVLGLAGRAVFAAARRRLVVQGG